MQFDQSATKGQILKQMPFWNSDDIPSKEFKSGDQPPASFRFPQPFPSLSLFRSLSRRALRSLLLVNGSGRFGLGTFGNASEASWPLVLSIFITDQLINYYVLAFLKTAIGNFSDQRRWCSFFSASLPLSLSRCSRGTIPRRHCLSYSMALN